MLSQNRLYILLTIGAVAFGVTLLLAQSGTPLLESSKDSLFLDETLLGEMPTSAQPDVRTSTSTKQGNIPIVVYHIVRPAYDDDSEGVKKFAQTPEVFDAQMNYLKENGYTVISFTELEKYFNGGYILPAKPIILSFDDGWGNQYTYAFPILKKYNYTATFFVFTNPIGHRGFMTWNQLKELLAAGMSIESHSLSHPYLTRLTDDTKIWHEIWTSKKTLEYNLGITVNQFAYPFGLYDAHIVAMVQRAGYTSARGDYWNGPTQSLSKLYTQSALNAPTTLAGFKKAFP